MIVLSVTLVAIPGRATTGQRIRTLIMGRGWWIPRVIVDPMMDVTNVPATRYDLSDKEIGRYMRQYMPRTYAALVERFDVLYLANTGVRSYQTVWLDWFEEGVARDHLGLLMTGGSESFGGRGSDPSWGQTPVGRLLPVSTEWVITDYDYFRVFKLDVVEPHDPLIASLPWHEAPPFYYINMDCRAKAGSSVSAYADIPGYPRRHYPVFVKWTYGEGRSVAVTPDVTVALTHDFLRWEYWPDFMINVIICTSGEEPSHDYEVVHNLRLSFQAYQSRNNAAISLMDFADRFGANLRSAEVALQRANGELSVATQLYLEMKVDKAADAMDDVLEFLADAEEMAIRARNTAMKWVFLVEWLVVMGTFLLSGLTLHVLLIKRRAYRDVGLTKVNR